VGTLLLGLDEPPQFAAGGAGIYLVQPLVIAVGDLFVISEVNQGQTLAVFQREPGELVEPGDRLWAHQRVIAKGHPKRGSLVVESRRLQVGASHGPELPLSRIS